MASSSSLPSRKLREGFVDWRTWTPQMFEEWGAVIGRMHALTKDYEPSDEGIRRRFWHEDADWNMDLDLYHEYPAFREKARRTRDWLLTLPTDRRLFRTHTLRPAPVELLLSRRQHPAIRLRQYALRLVHLGLHDSNHQCGELPAVSLPQGRV